MDPVQPLADPSQAQGIRNFRLDLRRGLLCAGLCGCARAPTCVYVKDNMILKLTDHGQLLVRRYLPGHGTLADPKKFLDSSL